jgi:hypothetical protein
LPSQRSAGNRAALNTRSTPSRSTTGARLGASVAEATQRA